MTREGMSILALCLFDWLFTLVCLQSGIAYEGNPLLAPFAAQGIVVFSFVKVISFAPGIIALELFARKEPVRARFYGRSAVVAFILLYSSLVLIANV